MQHYVIKFVSDLRQVGGFLRVIRFPPTNKTDRTDITEMLLKMALNTIKQTNQNKNYTYYTVVYIYICIFKEFNLLRFSNINKEQIK
jgi:hypothetical protein